jgi:hypothetical protein
METPHIVSAILQQVESFDEVSESGSREDERYEARSSPLKMRCKE